jgi:hypothetical protein
MSIYRPGMLARRPWLPPTVAPQCCRPARRGAAGAAPQSTVRGAIGRDGVDGVLDSAGALWDVAQEVDRQQGGVPGAVVATAAWALVALAGAFASYQMFA